LVFENDDEQIKRLLRNSRQFNGVFSSDTLSASTFYSVKNVLKLQYIRRLYTS